MKIALRIIKYALIAVCVGIVAVLCIVLWTGRDPAAVSRLAWTKEALAAYEADPEGFTVTAFKGFDDRTYSQDGRFGVSRVTRTADIDQWQALIRYNDSVTEALTEKRGESGFEDTERFVFTLEDDCGHVYTQYSFITEKSPRHSFVRLVFDGVKMSFRGEESDGAGGTKATVERVGSLRLCIYCREDVKNDVYPEEPEAFLYIYGDGPAQYEYKGTKSELPDTMEPSEALRSSGELLTQEKGTQD